MKRFIYDILMLYYCNCIECISKCFGIWTSFDYLICVYIIFNRNCAQATNTASDIHIYTLQQCLRCSLSGWLRSRTRSIISYTHLSHRLRISILILFLFQCGACIHKIVQPFRKSIVSTIHCVWINMSTMSIVLLQIHIATKRCIVECVEARAGATLYTYIYISQAQFVHVSIL